MLKVKLQRKKFKLDRIKESVKKLDNQTVDVGYFQNQGRHKGSGYSYTILAQALELGVFPNGTVRRPLPFMNKIGDKSMLSIGRSIKVKRAFRAWGRKLDKKGNPQNLLNAVGEYVIMQSKQVFNNPAYFPEAPNNPTPLYESGELAKHFTYRTSWDNRVRRV